MTIKEEKEKLLEEISSLTSDFTIDTYIKMASRHKQVRKSKIKYAEESIRKFIQLLKNE